MEKIKIQNLTFSYPNQKTPVLNNINLEISKGEFITLCGKSGCGKSTLLRHLKPIITPHGQRRGAIYFDGREISALTHKEQSEKIGFVMQNPESSIVCDKVWHELAFGLESLSCSTSEIRGRVAEMASFFGIQDWYYKDVAELSGGQKQLLNLASVMVMKPEVLILDEPTSQLDPISANYFLNVLSKINKDIGTAVILSEHRLEEALPMSDRVIVMDLGDIIAEGDVRTACEMLHQKNSDMLLAFPTPMRVSYCTEHKFDTPVTIRDGKKWLSQMPLNTEAQFQEKESFATKNTALKADSLYFRYEKNAPDVLKGLSLEIFENEFYAIAGGNGTGKTTLLSAIMGGNKPYRGKIEISENKKLALLPQNPQNLFSEKAVLLELTKTADANNIPEEKLKAVIKFCGLEGVLQSHPYDLSGGEQQKAALAKVLLCRPDIILLDEPTKGLDAHFKKRLGEMLKNLQKCGVTVIIVSHDAEFCAKYADRVGMFFDGAIVSEDKPRSFFLGKSFYTTASNKMAGDIRKDAVLDEDIIAMLSGKADIYKDEPLHDMPLCENIQLASHSSYKTTDLPKNPVSKGSLTASIIILLLIPLTIIWGIYLFGERRYYFISLLVILETMIPFALMFEGRKPKARELVIISVICATAVAGRVAFAMIPQFKPVIALVIISGMSFGGETGFLVGAITAFVSNFFFSQGPWTPWQMFSYGMTGFLAGIIFKKSSLKQNKFAVCTYGFLSTLIICGAILNTSYALIIQESITLSVILTYIMAGLPMDLVHSISTAVFLWLGSEPMCEKLDRVKIKYGMIKISS